jgi:F-type H+-transporting ATPase subunit delta
MTARQAADSTDQDLLAGDEAEVARRYAEALLSAADAENQAEAALEDLQTIDTEVLKRHPKFKQLLGSSQVSPAEKDRILVEIFGDRVSGVVLRFLRVLNRRGRLSSLGPMAREAAQIWDRRHKRIPVQVRTAVPLDEAQQTALRDQVTRMISATPVLQFTVDPTLIGGLVVQVGDQVSDASISNRLEQIRQRLIEGKTHEIQTRRDQFSYSA